MREWHNVVEGSSHVDQDRQQAVFFGVKYFNARTMIFCLPILVTGAAQYASDVTMPDMLHMKLVFAGRPHARIRSNDFL